MFSAIVVALLLVIGVLVLLLYGQTSVVSSISKKYSEMRVQRNQAEYELQTLKSKLKALQTTDAFLPETLEDAHIQILTLKKDRDEKQFVIERLEKDLNINYKHISSLKTELTQAYNMMQNMPA